MLNTRFFLFSSPLACVILACSQVKAPEQNASTKKDELSELSSATPSVKATAFPESTVEPSSEASEDPTPEPSESISPSPQPTTSVSVDSARPTVNIASNTPSLTNASSFPVVVTFNEAVIGFDLSDVVITNGVGSNFSGNGAVYQLTVSPSAQGLVLVDITEGAATDTASNPNSAGEQLSITYDALPPSIAVVTGAALTNDSTPTWTWTSSGGGNGNFRYKLDSVDLTESAIETLNTNFTPTSALSAGSHTLYVQERDGAGNWSASGSFLTFIDNTAPTVVLTSTEASPTKASPIPVTITFNESVTGFLIGDIVVGNGTKGVLSGSGAVYSLDVIPSGEGAVTVNVSSGVASDDATNLNAAATQLSVTYDSLPPTAPAVTGQSLTSNTQPTWSWTAGGGGNGTFRYKLDSSNFTTGGTSTTSTTYTPTSALSLTTHTLYVQERDAAGNWSASGSRVINVLAPPYATWIDSSVNQLMRQTIDPLGSAAAVASSGQTYGLERNGNYLYVGGNGITRTHVTSLANETYVSANSTGFVGDITFYDDTIYWTDYSNGLVIKAPIADPTSRTVIYTKSASVAGSVLGIAIAPAGDKVFVTIQGLVTDTPSRHMPGSRVLAMDPDGSNVVVIRSGWIPTDTGNYYDSTYIMYPVSVAADASYVYVSDLESRLIRRYSRSNYATVTTFQSSNSSVMPYDLRVDATNIYFSSAATGFGTKCLATFSNAGNCTTHVNPGGAAYLLAFGFTFDSDYYYYTLNEGTAYRVPKTNTSATPERLSPNTPDVYIYPRGTATDKVRLRTYIGTELGVMLFDHTTGLKTLLVSAPDYMHDIEIDYDNDFIYWAESGTNKIRRAGIDGSNPVTIANGIGTTLTGLAIHKGEGKLYWTDDDASHNVVRSNLDGTNVERLSWNTALTGTNPLANVTDIDYDEVSGKLVVMAGDDLGAIGLVNSDGTGYQLIVNTGILAYCGFSYDGTAQVLYYSTKDEVRSIHRDGSNMQTLYSGGTYVRYVAVDTR